MTQAQEQLIRRLSAMPWIYYGLNPPEQSWADDWQRQFQAQLTAPDTLSVGGDCFIAPDSRFLSSSESAIHVGNCCQIACDSFLKGPLYIADRVGINRGCLLDGGRDGIHIGANGWISRDAKLINSRSLFRQLDTHVDVPLAASGPLIIGEEVWIGAGAIIGPSITIGDRAVISAGSIVTRDVPADGKVDNAPTTPSFTRR